MNLSEPGYYDWYPSAMCSPWYVWFVELGYPLLDIRNLVIEATSYPPGEPPKTVTLVHGVSLTLEKGKVLGLIGESGAGKSTIGLSSMAYGRGGVRITGGEVILNGLKGYVQEVIDGSFPQPENYFSMPDVEYDELVALLDDPARQEEPSI